MLVASICVCWDCYGDGVVEGRLLVPQIMETQMLEEMEKKRMAQEEEEERKRVSVGVSGRVGVCERVRV